MNTYYSRCFHLERKERSDKGKTLINSWKKTKSIYTAKYVFKREQTYRRFRDHTHKLNSKELNEEFKNKNEEEKEKYEKLD